jgi:chromosome segregation ATPase
MSFRIIVFAVASSMLMLSPVQGEEGQAGSASTEASAPSVMEERIRAYRESFDRKRAQVEKRYEEAEERHEEAEERHEEAVARHESLRPPPPPQVAAQEEQLSARQQAMKKFREEQQAYFRKQQQEREALAAKWREARQKYQEARMETYLREREKKLADFEKQQEQMRNQAEDQHNYLVENQDKIMQRMLEQKVEVANRHEGLRKQADERRKKMVAARAAMADMTPRERMAYMQAHQQELFAVPEGMPARMPRGEARRPMPPWARQAPPAVPRAPRP